MRLKQFSNWVHNPVPVAIVALIRLAVSCECDSLFGNVVQCLRIFSHYGTTNAAHISQRTIAYNTQTE